MDLSGIPLSIFDETHVAGQLTGTKDQPRNVTLTASENKLYFKYLTLPNAMTIMNGDIESFNRILVGNWHQSTPQAVQAEEIQIWVNDVNVAINSATPTPSVEIVNKLVPGNTEKSVDETKINDGDTAYSYGQNIFSAHTTADANSYVGIHLNKNYNYDDLQAVVFYGRADDDFGSPRNNGLTIRLMKDDTIVREQIFDVGTWRYIIKGPDFGSASTVNADTSTTQIIDGTNSKQQLYDTPTWTNNSPEPPSSTFTSGAIFTHEFIHQLESDLSLDIALNAYSDPDTLVVDIDSAIKTSRLRRANDNAEDDFYHNSTNLVNSSNVSVSTWANGSDVFVTKLYNQTSLSGKSDLIQTDTAKQPKLNLSTLEVDFGSGTDNWYLYAEDSTKMLESGENNYAYAFHINSQQYNSVGSGTVGRVFGYLGNGNHATASQFIIRRSTTKGGFGSHYHGTSLDHIDVYNNTDYNIVMGIDDSSDENISIWSNDDNVIRKHGLNGTEVATSDLNLATNIGFNYGVQ